MMDLIAAVAIEETTYIPVAKNNEILANKVENKTSLLKKMKKMINEEVIVEKKMHLMIQH